jgi:hypothetical protein
MASLNNWQKDLVSEFLNKDETIKIHFFKDGDADCVRVIVSNPTTSVILDYSEAYTVFLENYSDMYLDFLVLGENEIRDFSKVPGVITINRM